MQSRIPLLRPAALGLAMCLWLPAAVTAGATEPPPARLVVLRTDGSSAAFFLGTVRRLDTGATDLVVVRTDGERFTFPFTTIRCVEIEPTSTTGVIDPRAGAATAALRLLPGFPNPARTSTTLLFDLPRRTAVTLDVFSVTGQRVRTFEQGELAPGTHSIVWDGNDDRGRRVSGGMYFYRMRGAAPSRRITILP